MKVLILAGGKGTRISEESEYKPKPMINIGNQPILVHIMQTYATCGFKDFVILAGYKQNVIKEYFANFNIYTNDVTFNLKNNNVSIIGEPKLDWNITVMDTGLETNTAGRVRRAASVLNKDNDDLFLLTYGDAVGNININDVIKSHKKSNKLATVCVYNFSQDKGVVEVNSDGSVKDFREKSKTDSYLINIGFMVIDKRVLTEYNLHDHLPFENTLEELAAQNQLNAYLHTGFWQCMDTLREKNILEELERTGQSP